MPGTSSQLLIHILQGEQSILSRTDQKAYTLLSILGVFMVFFIVYYRLLVVNYFIIGMLGIYFVAAFFTIWSLVRTILPRMHKESKTHTETRPLDPTYFGGIREFPSSEEYFAYLKELDTRDDGEFFLKLLSSQVHALANINWTKNRHLRYGVYCFIVAISAELLMILSTFVKGGLETLSR
jgi:hypothetical protein